ncbi:MAG: hypothetical protein JW768_08145 [Chitinispirillaceae bacterium]|nr:hypothetical protein [Chitinispirillaceae bacterium]
MAIEVTFISQHAALEKRVFTTRLALITAIAALSGALFGLFAAAPVIDETMPATIPAAVVADWEAQDNVAAVGHAQAASAIIASLPVTYGATLTTKLQSIRSLPATDPSWKALYTEACHARRVERMKPYAPQIRKILFAKHYNFGGPLIGFMDDFGMSRGTEYKAGGGLYVLEMTDYYSSAPTALIEDARGVIKDPCLSFDATKVLFAWKKDDWRTGYHLFEMDLANPSNPRQITFDPSGLTVSDYEPCYLPDGNIMFSSSRCFGMVDCAFNYTCNMFTCSKDGKYVRRIGYDQVHTFYPQMMTDGKILYTRWEYNDRLLTSAMGLFTMNPDGSHQTELFGNQTHWPMTFIHAKQIPNSHKILSVISGHHAPYSGELCIVDPNIARNGLTAIQLVAPLRDPPANPGYGTDGGVQFLFQNPLPLDEQTFIVSWRATVDEKIYKLYLMDVNANRELIAWDDAQSVSQPLLFAPRPVPPLLAYVTDYTKNTGAFMMQNVYIGTGVKGVRQGSIKKLRVVALTYRVDGAIGHTGTTGFTETPVARWTGSWEAKKILGTTPIMSDGSAAFIVPARVPVYFQLLDSLGQVVQTMRSWSTLMPGEVFSCLGCHEDKNESPGPQPVPIANVPTPLEPYYDVTDQPFSFWRFIQPVLDRKCISCHDGTGGNGLDLRGDTIWSGNLDSALFPDDINSRRFYNKSYMNLCREQRKHVDWITIFDMVTPRRPYPPGAYTSPMIKKLRAGHENVTLTTEEMDKLCCWIDLCIPHTGYYPERMTPEDSLKYEKAMDKRRAHEALEEANIKQFIADGQWNAGIDPRRGKQGNRWNSSQAVFSVRFSSSEKKLVVELPGEGKLSVLDLRGRQITSRTVSREAFKRGAKLTFRLDLPMGLYLIRFKGAHSSGQRVLVAL